MILNVLKSNPKKKKFLQGYYAKTKKNDKTKSD